MIIKRSIDLLLALVMVIPALAICFVAAALHAVMEKGNPIFIQSRLGKKEKLFKIYKLRTMNVGTVNAATHTVSASEVTTLGRMLRRTKIDELPQLINVIRGDMSFIGPRPCLPTQHELVSARRASRIFEVLPGISGLAQTLGVDMSQPMELTEIDADYISRQSVLLDLKLMAKTVMGSGSGDRTNQNNDNSRSLNK